jgi:hypothetical protein
MLRNHILAGLTGMFGFLVLTCCGGCTVFVQNRYSVFGFDRYATESLEQARVWSLVLLGGVSAGSASGGALSFWLVQRWRNRKSQRQALPSYVDTGAMTCEPCVNH